MQTHGFTLIKERQLAEVGGLARLWRHDKCGAQLLSIVNDDENKCFGANFYTPPTDSTGVAHILEHSVLCGSDKYPVKEPFVELLKGSLQTFLNAFTFPDKTCYPVASANLRDFYNLVDVYLDAVFHPRLSRDIFAQEGWHVEAESADQPWTFKGVVYNEMKGVYSSPDSILAEKSQQLVFPDNLYSLDSGGNPERIPDLTYAAFCDFHARYYQPGNCRFFFWGDDPEEERLRLLDAAIAGSGPAGVMPAVCLQQPLGQPQFFEVPYAATEGEKRAMFTINWLLGERGDIDLALRMEMLEHILEGLPGSPLRRALMESGLGEDTTGCGLETDLRQMYYSTGLKGVTPAAIGEAESLILHTLGDLADKGLDPAAVEAAVNTVEFAYRENNSGRFPRGLGGMIQSLSTWLYGGDPIAPLAWEEPLAKIRSAVAGGEKIFEKAIREYFLDNPHRVRVTLLPDATLGATLAKGEKARLADLQAAASPEAKEKLVRETIRLQAAQLAPDSPENLAKIPALATVDLPLKNRDIPCVIEKIPQTFLAHDLPTRGIVYLTMLLPITRLPRELVPWLPLFSRSLLEFGTSRRDYSQLGMHIAAKLGGLTVTPLPGIKIGTRDTFCNLAISARAVTANLPDMFDIIREILLEPQKNSDIILDRLAQMILEGRARLEYGLQAAGNAAVSSRLRARYTGDGALAEQISGISQLEYLRSLAESLGKNPAAMLQPFEELRALILSSQNAIVDCAAENDALSNAREGAAKLLGALPASPILQAGEVLDDYKGMNLPAGEAFITPGQVNYVGKGANLYDLGYRYKGSANVILRWLRMGRLWEDVRVAGGAYGVACSLDRIGGTLLCSSFRDPNVDRTLSAYDGMPEYLRNFSPTPAQLSQAIVGAVGDLDTYLLPDAKAALSLAWYLSGQDAQMRQTAREEMLGTTARDFREFADVLSVAMPEGDICVLGGAATESAAVEHGWQQSRLI